MAGTREPEGWCGEGRGQVFPDPVPQGDVGPALSTSHLPAAPPAVGKSHCPCRPRHGRMCVEEEPVSRKVPLRKNVEITKDSWVQGLCQGLTARHPQAAVSLA